MLNIDQNKCNLCGVCVSACPFGLMKMGDGQVVVDDTCVLCGACENACPCDAIEIAKKETKTGGFEDYKDVWVVAELAKVSNHLQKSTLELLSEGRKLARRLNERSCVLLLCKQRPLGFVEQIAQTGCDIAYIVESDELHKYDTDVYADTVARLADKLKPSCILFAASETGRDLAPKVSSIMKTGLTADCTGFDIDEDRNLMQIRPTYGGNIMASIITPNHRPQLASARPNVFAVEFCAQPSVPEVICPDINVDASKRRVRLLDERENENDYKDVMDSNIVIVGGYGVGSRENFKKLEKLAIKMGAAIGATRKAVDEGWAPFEIQVGQTGKTIAPDVYIGFGVSGALQHSIGIKNAKYVITVNSDPAAPIFSMSDEAVLGDCIQIAEYMTKLISG